MTTILGGINDSTRAGLTRDIDILLVQELGSGDAAMLQSILNNLPGSSGNYAVGPTNGGSLQQGVIYNNATVDLIGSQIITGGTGPRNPIRYQFRPEGLDSSYDFYTYNSHYDASDPPDRLTEAQAIRANADALGQGTEILYVGDYNIDNSSEGMYTTLLGSGNGQAFDPINTPGNWHNTASFLGIHSQNPAGEGFVGGGMDDRFDFILHTQEVGASGTTSDGIGLEYRSASYWAFGNNGTHQFNGAINSPGATGASQAVLDALAAASDHLPIVSDYDIVSSTPTVTFTTASQSGAENGSALTLTAQLSSMSSQAVTVPFTVTGTATGGGTDYTITASPITIPANQLTASITLTPINDNLDEANETVIVTMGTPTNGVQGAITVHTATLTDDDPTPTVTFTTSGQSGAEDAGTMTLTAQLSAVSGLAVTAPFTVGGTAAGGGADYSVTSSPITIPAGSLSANITINVVDDSDPEPNETVVVTMGTPTNAAQGATIVHTATILDDDTPTTLQVGTFTPTQSGFRVSFTAAPDATQLNLHNLITTPAVEAADVLVTLAGVRVNGTLVRHPSDPATFTWVATGGADGVLDPGTYSMMLRSATDGWTSTSLGTLDGDGNGSAGGDYTNTFTVSADRYLSVGNVVLGPSQPVPGDPNFTTYELPITVGNVNGISNITFNLIYNPNLITLTDGGFTITPAGAAAGFGAGLSSLNADANTSDPNAYVASFSFGAASPSASSGVVTLATFRVSVPAGAYTTALYTEKQTLDVVGLSINGGTIPGRDDDGVHVNAYLGDVNGNGQITPSDASRVVQLFGAGVETVGFDDFRLVDPVLLADANFSGTVTVSDGTRVLQEFGNPNSTNIPNAPSQPPVTPAGPDPVLSIPANLTVSPGGVVNVPIHIDVTEPAGIDNLDGITLVLSYDNRVFDASNLDTTNVLRGVILANTWVVGSVTVVNAENTDPTVPANEGRIVIGVFTSAPQDLPFAAVGSLLTIPLRARPAAPAGATQINLRADNAGAGNQHTDLTTPTGSLSLNPTPTNAATDVGVNPRTGQSVTVDGTVTVLADPTPAPSNPVARPPAPTLTQARVLGLAAGSVGRGRARRSALVVRFSGVVSVPAEGFVLRDRLGRSVRLLLDLSGSTPQQTVVALTFLPGPSTRRGRAGHDLIPGRYTLRVRGDLIRGLAGNGDGLPGGDFLTDLFSGPVRGKAGEPLVRLA